MTELDKLDARTLSTSALLVDYSLSAPSVSKKAKEKTTEVRRKEDTNAVSVNKEPYMGTNIKDIISLHSEVRKVVDETLTLAWEKGGCKLLPMTNYQKYIEYMTKKKDKHDELVQKFRNNIPVMVAKAPDRMKDLFDEGDYPDPDCEVSINNFMSKFKFDYENFFPVPEAGDFRVDVNSGAMDDLKTGLENMLKKRLELGKNSLWERGYDILKQWQDMPNKASVSKTTVHTNAENLIKLIDSANITNDRNLKRLRDDLELIVKSTNIEMLRDKDCRSMEKELLSKKAGEVLKKFDF